MDVDCFHEGSSEMEVSVTKRDIFFSIKKSINEEYQDIINILEKDIAEKAGFPIEISDEMEPAMSELISDLRARWESANRKQVIFLRNNKDWLGEEIHFSKLLDIETPNKRKLQESVHLNKKLKRLKTNTDDISTEELLYALQMKLRSIGEKHTSKIIKDIFTDPGKASKYIAAYQAEDERTLSPEEGLAILIKHRFSRRVYDAIRSVSKEFKCKLYPAYHKISDAKALCYPPRTSITINETRAEIELQPLLDKTASRIIYLQNSTSDTLRSEIPRNLILHCKWGCDESLVQGKYKRKFTTYLVPLVLSGKHKKSKNECIIWSNPRPASQRFCRPIRMQFELENDESFVLKTSDIEEQIKVLRPFLTEFNGVKVSIMYEMTFTVIDDISYAANVSSNHCVMCKGQPRQFSRNLSRLKVMKSIFNRMLIASDPYICSISQSPELCGNNCVEQKSLYDDSKSDNDSNGMYESDNE